MKISSTNPSRNFEVIDEVPVSTQLDVDKAISIARKAQPIWAATSVEERCNALASFINIAEKRLEEIARIIAQETGRPIQSSRGNVSGGIDYFRAYFEIAEEELSPKVTIEDDKQIHRVFLEPYGVISVISLWNYPFLNIAFQCGQALISGNTILYKNSEENPLFSRLLTELIEQSAIPEGVFNVLYGDGEVGEMMTSADIDMISFTGSTQTGKKLTKIAADKYIPIITELGGSSPGIVFEDADLSDETIELIYGLRFWNTGQSCDALKRLIVHESIFDEVVNRLTKIVLSKKLGDALDEDTDLGSLVADRQVVKLDRQVQDSIAKGAKVIVGGNRPKGLKGAFYEPTILTDVTEEMAVWNEETFGPVLPIVPFRNEDEAIQLANATKYGLGASIFTEDGDRYDRVARGLNTSMISHNSVMYWSPLNPFGGYKDSGMGRTHGKFGFADVTQPKVLSKQK
jgi:acyl-CoA reductase-like NAD-dependent aldehyde dehydrogenase